MKDNKNFGSDVIIDILKKHQINYVACNPGSTIRGLHDSIVNDETKDLKLILCCHEEIAVAVAHGYAKAAGKPMVVLLHANVGLLHACMAIFNAWCDRVPMIILGGIGPLAINSRRPWIDWVHTSQHQGHTIDGYVKWHDQPANLQSAIESLYRSFMMTNTEPKAPVYLSIDADIQEQPVTRSIRNTITKPHTDIVMPQASEEVIEKIADDLLAAKRPIIIADHMGRNPDSVEHLIALAELLQIPVVDCGSRFNFPNKHPLYVNDIATNEFNKIDYILAFDVPDLKGVVGSANDHEKYPQKVTHISLSLFLNTSWVADHYQLHPVDQFIAADSVVTLPKLVKACQHKLVAKKQLSKKNHLYRSQQAKVLQWQKIINSQVNDTLPSIPYVLSAIWDCIENEDWVLTNYASVAVGKWLKRIWDFKTPDQYLGNSGGFGLGYGLGASIGAALALKDKHKIAINLQGDGDFLFTPSALWTAAHYQVPLMIIVMNNGGYKNTKDHAIKIAKYRNRINTDGTIGNNISNPNVDFIGLAKSYGIKTFSQIKRANEVKRIVAKAIRAFKKQPSPILLEILIDDVE